MATETTPKAQVFSLRTPLLSAGSTTDLVAQGDLSWYHIKVYAQGGENALHMHPTEEHSFVILEGEATFYDVNENPTVVTKYQGVLLPKGALYYFQSTGDAQLVMLRIGAGARAVPGEDSRLGADGRPLLAHSKENKDGAGHGVPIPGKFFADWLPE